jgi:hypothetical protein
MNITTHQNPDGSWMATDDTYDGAPDSVSIVGRGETERAAINDYEFWKVEATWGDMSATERAALRENK